MARIRRWCWLSVAPVSSADLVAYLARYPATCSGLMSGRGRRCAGWSARRGRRPGAPNASTRAGSSASTPGTVNRTDAAACRISSASGRRRSDLVRERTRRGLGPVEADQGVEVDSPAALVLGDLGVLDGRDLIQPGGRDPEGLGDQPAQGDGEPSPQVRRPPLPDDVGGVVVAVPAQRLPQRRVVVAVLRVAGSRPAMRAGRRAAVIGWQRRPWSRRPCTMPERRRSHGGEHQRVLRHRLRDGLAAGDAGADQVEHVRRIHARAGRARARPTVPAADVRDPERLILDWSTSR